MDKSKPNTYILSRKYVCPHFNQYHMLQTLPTIIKKTKKLQLLDNITADLQESATKLLRTSPYDIDCLSHQI